MPKGVIEKTQTAAPPENASGERQFCQKGPAFPAVAALFLWACALTVMTLFFTAEASAAPDAVWTLYGTHIGTMLLNLLPPALVMAALFFFTGSVWVSALCTTVLTGALALSNYFKLTLRGDPLLALDLAHISEGADMVAGQGTYTLHWTTPMFIWGGAVLAALVLTAVFIRWRLPLRMRARVIAGVAAIAVLAVLTPTLYGAQSVYSSTACIDPNGGGVLNAYSDADQYVSRGAVYSFLHSVSHAAARKPGGYKAEEAAALLAAYESADIPEAQKVSVIAVMLEAYNDFSKFGLTFTQDPYENYHRLCAESVTGKLVTNIFAGGTIDTERGFLTGFSEYYEFRRPTPSLVSYFESQGYSTLSAHPGFAWFYDRRNVNACFGFDELRFSENWYEGTGALYNDRYFFEDLLRALTEREEAGEKLFCFAVTYQNHGPYVTDALDGDAYAARGDLSEEAYIILNNYLSGIARTDAAIGELTERLRSDKEPVVLLLFGDHNPWLGDGSFVYDELGIDLDRDTEAGFYNYYETPYLIWGNDAAKAALGNDLTGDGGSLSPMFLGEKLFSLLGYKGSPTIQAQRTLLDAGVDVVHELGVVRENGFLTGAPSENAQKALEDYLAIQYYLRTEG